MQIKQQNKKPNQTKQQNTQIQTIINKRQIKTKPIYKNYSTN